MNFKACTKALEEMDSLIHGDLIEIAKLKSEKEDLEHQLANKSNENKNMKINSIRDKMNCQNLSERNEEVMKKSLSFDEIMKEDNGRIITEIKRMYELLNVKVNVEEKTESLIEIKLEFLEKSGCFVTLLYDHESNEFDCE